MSKLFWRLVAPQETVLRHCQGCGKPVPFHDSGKTRLNANGKQLFQFAIFKCHRDHTWNRPVPVGPKGSIPPSEEVSVESPLVAAHWRKGLEIELTEVRGRWRLDKLLAHRLEEATRTVVADLIAQGRVRVNDRPVEGRHLLRSGDRIVLLPPS